VTPCHASTSAPPPTIAAPPPLVAAADGSSYLDRAQQFLSEHAERRREDAEVAEIEAGRQRLAAMRRRADEALRVGQGPPQWQR
jgi:hypothetical protein